MVFCSLTGESEPLLLQPRELDHLNSSEACAAEYCRRENENLGNFGNEEKRLLLEALRIKLMVHPDRLEIQGATPSYLTIGQTSACLSSREYTRNDGAIPRLPFRLEVVN